MKEFDYSAVPHYKFYGFVKKVFGPILKWLYNVEYKGLENVPAGESGYIVAINHTCMLDPVFVSMPKKVPPLHFMAKSELFENPVVAWVITHVYGFPVHRGKGDTSAIDYGIKLIREGHIMAICPEGRRVKDKNGVPQHAKAGVAVIAHATGADVLPVAICSRGPIKPFKKVVVSYGKMIKNEDLQMTDDAKPSQIKAAANMVMKEILDLWEAEV